MNRTMIIGTSPRGEHKLFSCMTEASFRLGISLGNVSTAVSQGRTAGGWKFKRFDPESKSDLKLVGDQYVPIPSAKETVAEQIEKDLETKHIDQLPIRKNIRKANLTPDEREGYEREVKEKKVIRRILSNPHRVGYYNPEINVAICPVCQQRITNSNGSAYRHIAECLNGKEYVFMAGFKIAVAI